MRPDPIPYALTSYALAAVPRYTSYPTAVQFEETVTARTQRDWLAAVPRTARLSVYAHLPFCPERCWYCGCHTAITRNYGRVADYARLLGREITLQAGALGPHAGAVHVHFGGGTPSYLAPDDFDRLLGRIGGAFGVRNGAEIAVELDPRTLTKEKARRLACAGVTRASLGIQDFNPAVQERINRWQPYGMVARAVDWLRASGIGRLSFDLMYGLPGQTVAMMERSVRMALTLSPDRLAVFGYAHVPWFKKHQRLLDEKLLPGVAERFAQASRASALLTAEGYRRIGLDHYALPHDPLAVAAETGRLRRNFQGYTDDPADALIGLGASAISALPGGYVQNVTPIGGYAAAVGAGRLAGVRGVPLSGEDRLRRAVIERIMCGDDVDLAALAASMGYTAADLADGLEAARALADDGLVRIDGTLLRIEAAGQPFLRNIAACFDRYWQPGAARHSRAV